MTIKASLHGPNRRRNRQGDLTVASNVGDESAEESIKAPVADAVAASCTFLVKSLEDLVDESDSIGDVDTQKILSGLGNACVFTAHGPSGKELLRRHADRSSPIYVHFHDIPVLVLRCRAVDLLPHVPSNVANAHDNSMDVIYLSRVHCHNHKVATGSKYVVTYCFKEEFPSLGAVGIEVYLRKVHNESDSVDGHSGDSPAPPKSITFRANDICRELLNQTSTSVLSVNETILLTIEETELVCRVADIRVADGNDVLPTSMSDVTMDDPYRGKVSLHTEFFVSPSDPEAITIQGGKRLPKGKLPDDCVHVTTSDGEWFPVRRAMLAPCIKLTKYVQAGRGKYKEIPMLPDEERSEDAPTDDGCPHVKVKMDCCTFDRVLLFLTSILFPEEAKFALDLSEVNALADAADSLGLQPLSDLCNSQVSSFDSRVRKDKYIRLAEVVKRNNDHDELLLILDGMVLDITRWIDEHPGGPSIIPTQALNIDSTVFFELYHVSRQAFLYLRSFYVGELAPEDLATLVSSAEGVQSSEGFLQSLRSYTQEWRVQISEHRGEEIHKSL